ncbi:MAG: hypothetical protein ACTHWU_02095 [Senegalia sp. (in: firmicutes)]|uniref:hypothetical protein n=1 Tax=Senegalia sp. (in: firmicutes) TaxID=1924098 RepID=UPI003F9AFEC5
MGIVYFVFGLLRLNNKYIVISMNLDKLIITSHNIILGILFLMSIHIYNFSYLLILLSFISVIVFALLFIDTKKFNPDFNKEYKNFSNFIIFNVNDVDVKRIKNKLTKELNLEENLFLIDITKSSKKIIIIKDKYNLRPFYFLKNQVRTKVTKTNLFFMLLGLVYIISSLAQFIIVPLSN